MSNLRESRCVSILFSLDDQELRRGMCVAGRCHQEAAASSQLWGRAEGDELGVVPETRTGPLMSALLGGRWACNRGY